MGIEKNKEFGDEMKKLKKTGDATGIYYGENHDKVVIHVIGPDFRASPRTSTQAVEDLSEIYKKVLELFVDSEIESLRLVPISGGIQAGKLWTWMGTITLQALGEAYGKLEETIQEELLKSNITMHMFGKQEMEHFTQAFEEMVRPRKKWHFHDEAQGHPDEWNVKTRTNPVNKQLKKIWGDVEPTGKDYHLVEDFLGARISSRGRSLDSELVFESAVGEFGTPGGIERFTYVGRRGPKDLRTGSHGTIPEALYSILEYQKLRHGVRNLTRKGEEIVGVYIHEKNEHKAEGYAIWTPVFEDGWFWRVVFEVKWDPELRVPVKHKDQTIVDPEGVYLHVLIIEKRLLKDINSGEYISKVWDPMSEANPYLCASEEAQAASGD